MPDAETISPEALSRVPILACNKVEVCGDPEYLVADFCASIYEPGCAPANVIKVGEHGTDFYVLLKWTLRGSLVRMIAGTWCVNVSFESIGPGEEFEYPEYAEIPFEACRQQVYYHQILVPKDRVSDKHCGTPYKLVATLTYKDPCGVPGPIAGFVELGTVLFYNPGPPV